MFFNSSTFSRQSSSAASNKHSQINCPFVRGLELAVIKLVNIKLALIDLIY
jgi:hypothetical protein